MIIFPAVDIINKKAVRLLKGDYDKKTVYAENPAEVASDFEHRGARFLHVVDLDGAKDGGTPNFDVVKEIVDTTSLKVEIGGGIRSDGAIEKYLGAGAARVILGTAAIEDPEFTKNAVKKYGGKIAVGVDVLNGRAAARGWLEISNVPLEEMVKRLENCGVETIICTDITKDGAMKGTNLKLYEKLKSICGVNIVASGGITTLDDIIALKNIGVYGAIVGKAIYEGAIDLSEAVEVAK